MREFSLRQTARKLQKMRRLRRVAHGKRLTIAQEEASRVLLNARSYNVIFLMQGSFDLLAAAEKLCLRPGQVRWGYPYKKFLKNARRTLLEANLWRHDERNIWLLFETWRVKVQVLNRTRPLKSVVLYPLAFTSSFENTRLAAYRDGAAAMRRFERLRFLWKDAKFNFVNFSIEKEK